MKLKLIIVALLAVGITNTAFAKPATQAAAGQSTGIAVCDKLLYEQLTCANIIGKDAETKALYQKKDIQLRTFFLNVYKTGDQEFIKAIEGSCMEGLTKFQSTGCVPPEHR